MTNNKNCDFGRNLIKGQGIMTQPAGQEPQQQTALEAPEAQLKAPKIPWEEIPSDDCVVHIGQVIENGVVVHEGQAFYPHEGESVTVLALTTVAEIIVIGQLITFADQDPNADGAANVGEHFGQLCKVLSKRIIQWNWTDMMGEPMDQPRGRPDILAGLTGEELVYLTGLAASPQSDETRKNGSGPSVDSSSKAPTTTSPSRQRR